MNPPAADLFEVVSLPVGDAPLSLAIALPRPSLLRMPGFPEAALPRPGRVASGRGLSLDLCRASALGEAAELASCCAWGTEALVIGREREIGPAALVPEALNGFSQGQIGERVSWNSRYAAFDWRPPPRDPEQPIEWLEVEDAYGGPNGYVPADFAFISYRQAGDDDAVAVGDSNGCACGKDTDSAKLHAVLELVERDAAARWWYGRRLRPSLDLRGLVENAELKTWLTSRRRHTRLFDITTDMGIPVMAAASAEEDGSDVALGFSSRLDIHDATASALTEMVQMELALVAARQLDDAAGHWPEWRARVGMSTRPLDPVPDSREFVSLRNDAPPLTAVLEACARHGIGVWFADMTREAIGIPAFRAIAPDLCHIKPRFARKRLLAPDPRDLSPVVPRPDEQVPLLM